VTHVLFIMMDEASRNNSLFIDSAWSEAHEISVCRTNWFNGVKSLISGGVIFRHNGKIELSSDVFEVC